MFGRVDFTEDERERERERERDEEGKPFRGCLVERGEEKMIMGPLWPTKKPSLQNGEKTWWGKI